MFIASLEHEDIRGALVVRDAFGAYLTCGADVDGDGVADILVAAPASSQLDGPAVYVVSGRTRTTLARLANPRPPSARSAQTADESGFGCGVTFVDDLDGDGISDIAVCAPFAEVFDDADIRPSPENTARIDLFSGARGVWLRSIALHIDSPLESGPLARTPDLDGDGKSDLAYVSVSDELVVHSTSSGRCLRTYDLRDFFEEYSSTGASLSIARDARGVLLLVGSGGGWIRGAGAGVAYAFPFADVQSRSLHSDHDTKVDVAALGDIDGDGVDEIALHVVRLVSGQARGDPERWADHEIVVRSGANGADLYRVWPRAELFR